MGPGDTILAEGRWRKLKPKSSTPCSATEISTAMTTARSPDTTARGPELNTAAMTRSKQA